MKNPYNNVSIFRAKKGNEINLIIIGWSRSGVARAFSGFGDIVLSTAGGGGYDKEGVALCGAIEKLYDVNLDANGAAGASYVAEKALEQGIEVKSLQNLIWEM